MNPTIPITESTWTKTPCEKCNKLSICEALKEKMCPVRIIMAYCKIQHIEKHHPKWGVNLFFPGYHYVQHKNGKVDVSLSHPHGFMDTVRIEEVNDKILRYKSYSFNNWRISYVIKKTAG